MKRVLISKKNVATGTRIVEEPKPATVATTSAPNAAIRKIKKPGAMGM